MPQMSPGEKLYNWLLDRYKRLRVDERSWIHLMSAEFDMDQLETFLMRSTVLMIVRRLIWNAEWYQKRYPGISVEKKYEKDYLLGVFGFESEDVRTISRLVFKSVETAGRDISPGLFKRLMKEAHNKRQKCEIGGCAIRYDEKDTHSSFSLDHKWPRSLGGSSEAWNLRTSCKRCNDHRKNIVEASDVHYEHFHVKSERTPDKTDSFWKELGWNYRIAALLQSDFRCERCEKNVTEMDGEVDFIQKNRDEMFHIFNIQVSCGKHRR